MQKNSSFSSYCRIGVLYVEHVKACYSHPCSPVHSRSAFVSRFVTTVVSLPAENAQKAGKGAKYPFRASSALSGYVSSGHAKMVINSISQPRFSITSRDCVHIKEEALEEHVTDRKRGQGQTEVKRRS